MDPFEVIFRTGKKYHCPEGQVLSRPDEEPMGVFYIYSGYVKAYDIDTTGEYQSIGIWGPGDIFPLYWALDENGPRLFYEAISPLEFSVLARSKFKRQTENNMPLLKATLAAVLKSFRYSQERIQNLELRTAKERIAFRLLFLAQHFGHKSKNVVEIAVPVTYQDMAESLSLTRETVNRTMRQLLTEGVVKRTNHHLTIQNIDYLRDIVGSETTLDI